MPTRKQNKALGRKFLVIIDNTEECKTALIYAAHRAKATNGRLVLLSVISPAEFQHWIGIGNIMREEATRTMQEALDKRVEIAKSIMSDVPNTLIREGIISEEILKLIEEDEDIAILVLAAGTGKDGPGPLVSNLATKAAGTFPIPVTIVPGAMSDEDIQAIA